MATSSAGPSPSVRVRAIPGKGRGVVAARPLAKGEVIERDLVLVIPADEWPSIEETIVCRYCFSWPEGGEDAAIALGNGSFLNHSYAPNAVAWRKVRQRAIEFVALRDIDEDEEVTLNYNGDPDDTAPMGFRVRDG